MLFVARNTDSYLNIIMPVIAGDNIASVTWTWNCSFDYSATPLGLFFSRLIGSMVQ